MIVLARRDGRAGIVFRMPDGSLLDPLVEAGAIRPDESVLATPWHDSVGIFQQRETNWGRR